MKRIWVIGFNDFKSFFYGWNIYTSTRSFFYTGKNQQTVGLKENDNSCPKDNNAVDELQIKLKFLEEEKLLLKEEAKHKQNMI